MRQHGRWVGLSLVRRSINFLTFKSASILDASPTGVPSSRPSFAGLFYKNNTETLSSPFLLNFFFFFSRKKMNLKHRHSFKRKCPPFALNDFFSQKVFTEKSTSTSRQQEMVLIVEPPSSPLTHAHTHTHTRVHKDVCVSLEGAEMERIV